MPPAERLAKYEMIVTPALYCTSQELRIACVRSLKWRPLGFHHASFVSDDEVTVWADRAPHNLTDVFGMTYSQFTRPNGHVSVEFAGALAETASTDAQSLIELLNADADTEVLASYGTMLGRITPQSPVTHSARAMPSGLLRCLTPIPFVRLCARLWNMLVLPLPELRSRARSRFVRV